MSPAIYVHAQSGNDQSAGVMPVIFSADLHTGDETVDMVFKIENG